MLEFSSSPSPSSLLQVRSKTKNKYLVCVVAAFESMRVHAGFFWGDGMVDDGGRQVNIKEREESKGIFWSVWLRVLGGLVWVVILSNKSGRSDGPTAAYHRVSFPPLPMQTTPFLITHPLTLWDTLEKPNCAFCHRPSEQKPFFPSAFILSQKSSLHYLENAAVSSAPILPFPLGGGMDRRRRGALCITIRRGGEGSSPPSFP